MILTAGLGTSVSKSPFQHTCLSPMEERAVHCSREHSSTFLPHPQTPHVQFFLLQAAFVLIAATPLLQQSEGLRCPFSWLVPLL